MKHFTIAILGREILSFIWGQAGEAEEAEFVHLGGDFEIAVDPDEDVEARKPRIGFWS